MILLSLLCRINRFLVFCLLCIFKKGLYLFCMLSLLYSSTARITLSRLDSGFGSYIPSYLLQLGWDLFRRWFPGCLLPNYTPYVQVGSNAALLGSDSTGADAPTGALAPLAPLVSSHEVKSKMVIRPLNVSFGLRLF